MIQHWVKQRGFWVVRVFMRWPLSFLFVDGSILRSATNFIRSYFIDTRWVYLPLFFRKIHGSALSQTTRLLGRPVFMGWPSDDIGLRGTSVVMMSTKLKNGILLQSGLTISDLLYGSAPGLLISWGMNLGLLCPDLLASYGVELEESAGQIEDRRYALQMSLEVCFSRGRVVWRFDGGLSFTAYEIKGVADSSGAKLFRAETTLGRAVQCTLSLSEGLKIS